MKHSFLGVGPDKFGCSGNKFDGNPLPEFCAISFDLLDCFGTAVISAPDLQFRSLPLILTCRLGEKSGALMLYFVALLGEGEQTRPLEMTEESEVWVASRLRLLAKAKDMALGNIYWDYSGPHLLFFCPYTGQMVKSRVVGLGDPGADGKARWPVCQLVVNVVDGGMLARATQAVNFSSEDSRGSVH